LVGKGKNQKMFVKANPTLVFNVSNNYVVIVIILFRTAQSTCAKNNSVLNWIPGHGAITCTKLNLVIKRKKSTYSNRLARTLYPTFHTLIQN